MLLVGTRQPRPRPHTTLEKDMLLTADEALLSCILACDSHIPGMEESWRPCSGHLPRAHGPEVGGPMARSSHQLALSALLR